MTREAADRLVAAFRDEFGGEVESFPEDGAPDRYQFTVSSPKLRSMTTLQRQDLVWEVIDRVLSRDDSLDVVMVWTFAPGEINEWIEGLST